MNKTMLLLLTVICVMAISYNPRPAFATDPCDATCTITVTVDSIIEWDTAANNAFPDIDLDQQTGHITAQASSPEGTAALTLWTNCNVNLSADNSNLSQLTHNRGGGAGTVDMLVTNYWIKTDGDGDGVAGVTKTGATTTALSNSLTGDGVYALYGAFLTTPLEIVHANTDGAVVVTLGAKATNTSNNVADKGSYEATQTITVAWTSDDIN